jgi:hypothetical protein
MMPDADYSITYRQRINDLINLKKFDRAADEACRALQKELDGAKAHHRREMKP